MKKGEKNPLCSICIGDFLLFYFDFKIVDFKGVFLIAVGGVAANARLSAFIRGIGCRNELLTVYA